MLITHLTIWWRNDIIPTIKRQLDHVGIWQYCTSLCAVIKILNWLKSIFPVLRLREPI